MKLLRRARSLAMSRLYQDRTPDLGSTFLIAGTARSGTTWLADVLSDRSRTRVMFEPFHPRKVPGYAGHRYFQYRHPSVRDPVLEEFCKSVFSGRIRNPWVDREARYLRPRGRIIKEIRANLLLGWIRERFPTVPMVLLLRHPCAVVLSRMNLGWATDTDLDALLEQPELISDHLSDLVEVIRGASTPEEKHAVIWCVSYLVPLRQFADGALEVVFYERVCMAPDRELTRLATMCPGLQAAPGGDGPTWSAERPSSTSTGDSAVVEGSDRVRRWQDRLSPEKVDRILGVVRAFGLDHLYDRDPMPEPGSRPPMRT